MGQPTKVGFTYKTTRELDNLDLHNGALSIMTKEEQENWLENWISKIADQRVITLFLLGFSAGIPILLIFSTLSIWLKQAGIERSAITFFSWAALGYGFKFIWAPLLDQLSFPVLCARLGQRRGWLLVTQAAVMASLVGMSAFDPAAGSTLPLAIAAVALGFSSASQDIVIDAYRIEIADADSQAILSASYIAGYRVAMIAAGAGLIKLIASWQLDPDVYQYEIWRMGYMLMGATMLVGVATCLLMKEPDQTTSRKKEQQEETTAERVRFLLSFVLAVAAFIIVFKFGRDYTPDSDIRLFNVLRQGAILGFAIAAALVVFRFLVAISFAPNQLVQRSFLDPAKDMLSRFRPAEAAIILLAIASYRSADILMGAVANIFYLDVGFDLDTIADYSKTYGLIVTIIGGFVGGALCLRYRIGPILIAGAALATLTNLLFAWVAVIGAEKFALAIAITADNLSAGLASTAFVAWLSSLTNTRFTASQYALFTSLMVLGPKLLAGYSGSMVDEMGYAPFFIMTTIVGLPVIWIVWRASRISARQS